MKLYDGLSNNNLISITKTQIFFQHRESPNSHLKLAFIHKIDHHIDIGLLELFLLTYSNTGNDYHCIHINDELTGESPKILKSMVECFNQIWEEKRIFIANQGNIGYRIFKNIYKKLFLKHLFSK